MTTSPLANPTATRELLEEFGLATKHRLGQNFLIDNHVIERICELAELAGDGSNALRLVGLVDHDFGEALFDGQRDFLIGLVVAVQHQTTSGNASG